MSKFRRRVVEYIMRQREEELQEIEVDYDLKQVTIALDGKEEDLFILAKKYFNGASRVELWSSSGPWCVLSVNVTGDEEDLDIMSMVRPPTPSAALPPGYFFVKNWSENANTYMELISRGYLRITDSFPPARKKFVTVSVGYFVKTRLETSERKSK